MRRRQFLSLTACSAVVATGTSSASAGEAARDAPDGISVAPLLRFTRGDKIVIPIVFANNSGAPFNYLVYREEDGYVWNLQCGVLKDGKTLERTSYPQVGELDLNVRTLQPGKSVVHHANVSGQYGDLGPGTYELRAIYHIAPNDGNVKRFGLTPFVLNRAIVYFEIVDPVKPGGRGGGLK
jgi:hypothetical protein